MVIYTAGQSEVSDDGAIEPFTTTPLRPSRSSPLVVHEGGPGSDEVVALHYRCMWVEAGMQKAALLPELPLITTSFIDNARQTLGYKTFVAVNPVSGRTVGSVSCQVWAGPIPKVVKESSFKLGTCWAVYVRPEYRRRGLGTALMEHVKAHWRSLGCQKGVLLHVSDEGRELYKKVGFAPGNILLLNLLRPHLPQATTNIKPLPRDTGVCIAPKDEEADAIVSEHWRSMWNECGVPNEELAANFDAITHEFIRKARKSLQYQTFVAREAETGKVVGSASAQVWSGPIPQVLAGSAFKMGTVWAVYVRQEFRCRGIATKLMEHCIAHWREIGCQKGVLLYASDEGRRVYQKLGFEPENGMMIDLTDAGDDATEAGEEREVLNHPDPPNAQRQKLDKATNNSRPRNDAETNLELTVDPAMPLEQAMAEALRAEGVTGDDRWLQLLVHALPQQLEAAFCDSRPHLIQQVQEVQRQFGEWIDPSENWFTQNVQRFGGGFDMEKLRSEPGLLAAKFDRLSSNYAAWTVGNKSRVEKWLTQQARSHSEALGGSHARVLDVACGIGLPSHQLRLCGYHGHFTGTDVSSGMVEQARKRGVYDATVVGDANAGGMACFADGSFDLVICTGALELLDHDVVLAEFCRVLKPGGWFWASFQEENEETEAARKHPTEHQKVKGVTLGVMTKELSEAGFEVTSVQHCSDAFHTPSPARDGTLLPVPYTFVSARRGPATL